MAEFDSGYKLLFSHPELVADLLRGFVPEPWVAEVDFATLTPVKGSYVSEELRQRHDDVVWKVRLREQWLYVYVVIEFQSEPDPFMALRLLVYVGMLYQDLLRRDELPTDGRLPPVLPIVLYHGTPAWTGALEFRDLLTPAPPGLERYQPRFQIFVAR
jgi:predicted transposase/invertase (TIGR01784 family)